MARGAACALFGGAVPAAASISRAHLEHGLSKQMHRVGGASGAWVYDLDAPEMPLVPLAALVIVVDIVMLIAFTRQRKAALAELEQGTAGLSG